MRLWPHRSYYLGDPPVPVFLLSVTDDTVTLVPVRGLVATTTPERMPCRDAEKAIEAGCRAQRALLIEASERHDLPWAPPEIERLGLILTDRAPPAERLEDHYVHVVTVRAKNPPIRRTVDNDPWVSLEFYGSVEHDSSGEPWVYRVLDMTGRGLHQLRREGKFDILAVDGQPEVVEGPLGIHEAGPDPGRVQHTPQAGRGPVARLRERTAGGGRGRKLGRGRGVGQGR